MRPIESVQSVDAVESTGLKRILGELHSPTSTQRQKDRALIELAQTLGKMTLMKDKDRPFISRASAQSYLASQFFASLSPQQAAAESIFWFGDYITLTNSFGNYSPYLRGPFRSRGLLMAESLFYPIERSEVPRTLADVNNFYLESEKDAVALSELRTRVVLERLGYSSADSNSFALPGMIGPAGIRDGFIQLRGDPDTTGRLEHFMFNLMLGTTNSGNQKSLLGSFSELATFSEFLLPTQNASISDFRVNFLGQDLGAKILFVPLKSRQRIVNEWIYATIADESVVNPVIVGPLTERNLAPHFDRARLAPLPDVTSTEKPTLPTHK